MNRVCFIACLIILALFNSCTKDSVSRCDWQIVDNSGTDLKVIYNKTEAELMACTDCGITSSGSTGTSLGEILKPCNYFSLCEPTFCWASNGQYIGEYSEKRANCNPAPNKVKVDCASCILWYLRTKTIYVPTGQYQISTVTTKKYCADTTILFNSNAQIVIRSTPDTLYVLERRKEGGDWK